MGCPALRPPPTWGLATPLMLPRPRAASPAKSLAESQSWSMTVKSTQAARRRQASAGTELRAQAQGHLENQPRSPWLPTADRGHSQVEEFIKHGVQCAALHLRPLAAYHREEMWRTQFHDHEGVA